VQRDAERANSETAREIGRIEAEYKRNLSRLLGARGMRELDAIRSARRKISRARRVKRSLDVLNGIGVQKAQILELRLPYLKRVREILDDRSAVAPLYDGPPCDNPWVTYRAPFAGYSWAYAWERTSNPSNPDLERYLDTQSGEIGSRIDVKDSSAGDDDSLQAEYYTGLNVWHTPLSTGVLEMYLAFEFNRSPYSGKIRDEWGISSCTHQQWAGATFLAADAVDPVQRETGVTNIYNKVDVVWGDDDDWSKEAAKPRDRHWYFFRTAATFQQGSSVMIEAGVRHSAWIEADDESVSLKADLNMRLDAIIVRSCTPEIIL
jgi:hypothetical protein